MEKFLNNKFWLGFIIGIVMTALLAIAVYVVYDFLFTPVTDCDSCLNGRTV